MDDCSLMQTDSNPVDILSFMQDLINSWGSLMEDTGGSLRTDKSWYYLVDYIWRHGTRVATDPEINMDLVATYMNGERMNLSNLRCNKAAEMLRSWIEPDGNRREVGFGT